MAPRRTEIADTLRQRFLSALHLGLLAPGARLPSVRELAIEFGVDRRVAAAAYHALEREGLVELRQRSGIFFAPPHATGASSPSVDWVVDVLVQGATRGIAAPDFAERFRRYVSALPLRAACVECNDDQIDSLREELRAEYGFETQGVDADALLAGLAMPELRRADLLVTTLFHAGEVKEVAEYLRKPWLAVSYRMDVFAAVARLLAEGVVYFVVTDERFAVKLREIFATIVGGANLHPLVEGDDDLTQIPPDVPVYVTRAAHRRLRDPALLSRVVPESGVFSRESERELLTFVVRANMQASADRAG